MKHVIKEELDKNEDIERETGEDIDEDCKRMMGLKEEVEASRVPTRVRSPHSCRQPLPTSSTVPKPCLVILYIYHCFRTFPNCVKMAIP